MCYVLLDPCHFENKFVWNQHPFKRSRSFVFRFLASLQNGKICQHPAPELSPSGAEWLLTLIVLPTPLPLVGKYFSVLPNQRDISLKLCFYLRKDHGIFFLKATASLVYKTWLAYWHLYLYAIENGACYSNSSRGVWRFF